MTRHPSILAAALAAALVLTTAAIAQEAEATLAAPAAPTPAVERIERGALLLEGVPEIPARVTEALRAYSNVRGHGFSDWAAEGILISTRFGETSQVHHVRTPLSARRQLTFYAEPIGGADSSPDGRTMLFGRDQGGDENFQAFLAPIAGGAPVQITAPGTRNGAAEWSKDGRRIAWYVSTFQDPDWDIVVADAADPAGTRRVVLEGEGAMTPLDWSADGARLLVGRYVSNLKSHRYVLDLASGALTEIAPERDVAYGQSRFVDGGRAILTTTDTESEFFRLVRVEVATGAVTVLTPDIPWDVEGFDVAPDGRTVVFGVNEGGNGVIRLLDLRSGRIRPGPDLPTGVASGFQFSPDGRRVGFTFSSPTSAGDAWSFDVRTLALTRWTEAEVGGLDPERFVNAELIAYPNADGMQIPAFVSKPAGAGPHPVLIDIHGGPAAQVRPTFSAIVQYWTNELGVAVIRPNVRGSSGYGKTYVSMDDGFARKKSVEDIGALLDWIETQPDLDSSRVVVHGGSYGGYMVLASLVDYAERLAGGVNIVGISNFVTFLENTAGYRRDLRRVEYGDERDPEMRAYQEAIAPANNADKITKPLFIIQGLNDPRVPASEAEQILAAVRVNGSPAWYLAAKDEGHGFRKKSNRDVQDAAVTVFLEDVLALRDP